MTEEIAPTGPDREYLGFLAEGRFRIQRDPSTGEHVFYPRVLAPRSGGKLEWVDASGRGHVYATTTVRAKPPAADYNVCIVQLDEGPRMLSRVENLPPAEVRIGLPVKARISQEGDMHFVVFEVQEDRT